MRKRIEQLRQQENLTQEAFAKRLGMSRNFIWMVENGKREVSDRTIADICREFGVNETWLRTGEGEMYVKTTDDALDNVLDKYALPRELRGLFLGYLNLSEGAKAELRGMLLHWAEDAAQTDPVKPKPAQSAPTPPETTKAAPAESVASNKRLSADEIADRVEAYRRELSGEPPETPEERHERHKREARAEADEYYEEVLQEKIAAVERAVSGASSGESIA